MAAPPFDLCQLKSFTVISCSLACWRRAAYVISSLLFQSDPFFDFEMFGCMKRQLCSMYHLLIFRGVLALFDYVFYAVGLVGQLSLVLPVRCHCKSCQCGSSRRLTLLESLWWPWILPQDSFGFPHLLKWAMCSTIWNLPHLGNLQLWQTIHVFLDAWCSKG